MDKTREGKNVENRTHEPRPDASRQALVDQVVALLRGIIGNDRDQAEDLLRMLRDRGDEPPEFEALADAGREAVLEQITVPPVYIRPPLPCPPWCVANHDKGDPGGLREHRSESFELPFVDTDYVSDSERTASVDAAAVDDLDEGLRMPTVVWIDAPGNGLTPANARRLAAALLNAADLAEDGRSDNMTTRPR